jgi:hypothetical protein
MTFEEWYDKTVGHYGLTPSPKEIWEAAISQPNEKEYKRGWQDAIKAFQFENQRTNKKGV